LRENGWGKKIGWLLDPSPCAVDRLGYALRLACMRQVCAVNDKTFRPKSLTRFTTCLFEVIAVQKRTKQERAQATFIGHLAALWEMYAFDPQGAHGVDEVSAGRQPDVALTCACISQANQNEARIFLVSNDVQPCSLARFKTRRL
jgi:hypothetical protein